MMLKLSFVDQLITLKAFHFLSGDGSKFLSELNPGLLPHLSGFGDISF